MGQARYLKSAIRLALICPVLLGAAGCQTKRLEAPETIGARPVTAADGTVLQPIGAAVKDQQNLQPLSFAGMQYAIPRGSEIGHVDYNPILCHPNPAYGPVHWNNDRATASERDWKDGFFHVLSGHGYKLAGDPAKLFQEVGDEAPVYVVGANLKHAHVNASASCHFLTGLLVGVNATSKVTVEWQLYSPLQRRVVWRGETEGSHTTKNPVPAALIQPLTYAFADAANKLALTQAFHDAVAQRPNRPAGRREAAAASEGVFTSASRYIAPLLPLSTRPLVERIDAVRSATVLIDLGDGHGSGFLVSSSGFVVTNEHVVEGNRFVNVRLISGRSVVGEVLYRDHVRDVALVKLEGEGYPALAVRPEPVSVGEEVYAIGAPQMKTLAWTVTRGIVSAYRQAMDIGAGARLDIIQSDVAIHGGNSGGPLVDAKGNLVGIAVLGWGGDRNKRNTSLNGFIPIREGLDKLGLEFLPEAEIRARQRDGRLGAIGVGGEAGGEVASAR